MFLSGLALALALALFGMLLYLGWCLLTMGYSLEGDALLIGCGGVRHIVPLASIEEVYSPGEMVEGRAVAVRWLGSAALLPGYVVGEGRSAGLGRVVTVATAPTGSQAFVATGSVAFGISPQDAQSFVRTLRQKLDRVDTEQGDRPRTVLRGPSTWGAPLWTDRLMRGFFLGGLLANALLFGYMSLVYASLPESLPLHWNAQAQIDRIGDPSELLRLPAFALGVWLVNIVAARLVIQRERAATLFLLAGGAATQVVFAAGAISIVARVN